MSNIAYNVKYNKDVKKCKLCGCDTVFNECIKCVGVNNANGKISEEKNLSNNNIKSIMDVHKYLVLKKFSKEVEPDKNFKWTVTEKKPELLDNWGIICNKKSGLMGVDIDYYKWKDSNVEKVKEFKELFADPSNIDQFAQYFSTFTQQTPNGGLHLVFLYDTDLNQTASNSSSKFGAGIDIRNGHKNDIKTGGYLVGYGSEIITNPKTGEKKSYKLINDVAPKKIPEDFKNWLLENIYATNPKKNKNDNRSKSIERKETEFSENLYSYLGDDDFIENEIIKKIPNYEKYIYDYETWLLFTSAMKCVNKFNLWEKYSKKYGGEKYDKAKNTKVWNSIKMKDYKLNPNIYFEHLIGKKQINNYDLVNYIKYKPLPKNNKIPDKLYPDKPEFAKLSNFIYLDLNDISGGIVIQSDTATGKTSLMKRSLINSNQKFMSLVSRKALACEQHTVFNEAGLSCGLYKTEESYNNDSIISQIDSFKYCCSNQIEEIQDYTIFLDEFNSMLEYLFQADTCLKDRRASLWKYLIYCLENCKNFICTDADISDLCFNFLDRIKVDYKFYKNQFKHFKGKKANEIYSLNTLIDNIIKELEKTKKAFVCCDSKASAEFIYNECKKKGHTALLLTSATDILEGSLDDHDFIIVSPVIIYGLDSVKEKKVFVYYKEHTISPSNMVQQIARIRNPTSLEFCFQKKKFKQAEYIDFEDCKRKNIHKFEKSKCEFDYLDAEEMKRHKLFFDLWLEYEYKRDCFDTNKYVHFKDLLVTRGWEVITKQKKTHKPDKDESNYIKESILEYKNESFNIESDYIKNFNEKYLDFTDAQIKDCKDLFISESAMRNYFSMNSYFTKFLYKYGDEEIKELDNNEDIDKYGMTITAENIADFYNVKNEYSKISEKDDFKFKKIDTQKYKFYVIDKLKLYSGYKQEKKTIGKIKKASDKNPEITNVYNTVQCTRIPSTEQQNEIINKYLLAFDHRGKKPPTLNTTYDCEKLIVNMMKKALNDNIFNKPIKTRIESKTKYTHSINYNSDIFKLLRKVNKYKQMNQLSKDIKKSLKPSNIKGLNSCAFIDDDLDL
mgnify:CR=1 FL=1|tara:strand:+ start:125 stop:3319 length:3195 start_codon:yes stop_codon:yes gene_type:complete